MSLKSGWCSAPPGVEPKHMGCRLDLCTCECHLEAEEEVEQE